MHDYEFSDIFKHFPFAIKGYDCPQQFYSEVYTQENLKIMYRESGTKMFRVALFIIAKKWK